MRRLQCVEVVGQLSLLFMILFVLWPGTQCRAMDERTRIRLIKTLSSSVVGVNSTVLNAGDLVSPQADKGTGSGFVVDAQGHVATLSRVIADRHAVEVVLWDGTTWPAIFMGEDAETGIAVLSVQAPQKVVKALPLVQFASQRRLLIGQDVLALGRTEGGEMLMAASGMVGSGPRTLMTTEGGLLYDVVQIDRPFARVLDGGALFDSSGHVIGMTACSLMGRAGGKPQAGFAIPVSTVKWVVSCIIKDGEVKRAWLGASLVSVTPSLASFLGLPVSRGALITEVSKGGPAEKAGLRGSEKTLCLGNRVYPVGGDIIVAMGRSDIKSDADVIRKLKQYKPGDTTLISVYRGSRLIRLRVTLGRRK